MASFHPETSLCFNCKKDFSKQRNTQTVICCQWAFLSCLFIAWNFDHPGLRTHEEEQWSHQRQVFYLFSLRYEKERRCQEPSAKPSTKRVCTQPDPVRVQREPRTRLRAVVPISHQEPITQLPITEVPTRPCSIVLNSHQVARVAVVSTSTPLDRAGH